MVPKIINVLRIHFPKAMRCKKGNWEYFLDMLLRGYNKVGFDSKISITSIETGV